MTRPFIIAAPISRDERNRRRRLSDEEAQRDAEASCVPCKLCGGKAVISDAGPGWGYYINCEKHNGRKGECFQSGTRISGWAYNVADRWNELNAPAAPDLVELVEAAEGLIPAALHFGGLTDAHLAAIERLETIIAKIKEPRHG